MRSPEDASSALRDVIGLSRSLDDYATTQLNWPGSIVYAHHRGLEVGCLLMDRLAALGRRYGAQVLVVSYPEHPMLAAKDMSVKERLQAWAFGKHIRLTPRREEHLKDSLVSRARDRHLQELDLFPAFAQLDPTQQRALFNGHFSVEGNRFVAAAIKSYLDDHPLAQ